jgi:hypothetical protein
MAEAQNQEKPTVHATSEGPAEYTYSGPNLGVTMNVYQLLRMIDQIKAERDDAPRSDWFIAAAGIFISIVLVAQTADFKQTLGIPPSQWATAWTLIACASFAMMAVQGGRLAWQAWRHPMKTSEQFYEGVLAAHDKEWKELEDIRQKYDARAAQAPSKP